MQRTEINKPELPDDKKLCPQCEKMKPLMAFPRQKGKIGEYKEICCECEQIKQYERHRRVIIYREKWQQHQSVREERRLQEWSRKIALRQAYEERRRELEDWFLQQPDRCCRMCYQVLPAFAFGGTYSVRGFTFHTRCMNCHKALFELHQLSCCLCHKKISSRDFISHYNGYALSSNGIRISLCCKGCEGAFHALSNRRQETYIRSCCQRTFPVGQVIYAEVDPGTDEIRYVGRTGKPKRRHAQHLYDSSPTVGQWGAEKKVWYTRSNWMYSLSEKGILPSMQILHAVDISPLVVEWEQRYIWHGIQQEWNLLNVETMDERLIDRIKAMNFNFLQVPFEILVQQNFFPLQGLVAFLRKWY